MIEKAVLKKHYRQVFFIKPNSLGNRVLDDFFHKIVPYLKKFPFAVLVPLSFFLSLILVFLFKRLVISLVSLFQYGF